MTDLVRSILAAWDTLSPRILSDPAELRRRLARRRSNLLQSPLRHHCIALRACDRRITPAWWPISPSHALDLDHPAHPYTPVEHDVLITTFQLRKFCQPVTIDSWGEEVPDVAKRLGSTPHSLRRARQLGHLRERKIHRLGGKPGPPIPLINCDRPLDPSSASRFAPDPICGTIWQDLPDLLPEKFQQAVTRVPMFSEHLRRKGTSGSGTHARLIAPDDHLYKDECQFTGYRWICPDCKKLVRTIYLPIAVRTLCDWIHFEPALSPLPTWLQRKIAEPALPSPPLSPSPGTPGEGRGEGSLDNPDQLLHESRFKTLRSRLRDIDKALSTLRSHRQLDLVPKPLPTFACYKCHRIRFYSGADRNSWNILVAHLSTGLLFSHEVSPPPWHHPGENRKRRRIRQLNRSAPRREAVLDGLLKGWSNRRIARELHMSIWSLDNHIRILCRQEDVPDRHALVAKFGAKTSPPLNQIERAAQRRFLVQDLVLTGLPYKQIAKKLHTDTTTLFRDMQVIYRLHQIRGHGHQARRALAAILGREYPPTKGDLLRQKIRALRATGLTSKEMAKSLNLSFWAIENHLRIIRREQKPPTLLPPHLCATVNLPASAHAHVC